MGEFRLRKVGGYMLDGKNLGKGAFARVELATHILSNTKVALKQLNLDEIEESYLRKNILRESMILKSLRHDNIVRLYETMTHQSNYYFVTEYLSGGNLLNHLQKQKGAKKLGEKPSRKIFVQLLSAVQYLHRKGIIHRDLKLQNIMLTENGKIVKLIDFGLSNYLNKDNLLTTRCGSAEFAAPELFEKGRNYGPAVEIWSLGVILFTMTIGKMPFQASTNEKKESFIVQVRRGLNISHEHYLQRVSKELKSLLSLMLEPDENKRITLSGVVTSTWVTENGKCPLLPSAPDVIPHSLRSKIVERVADLYSQPIDVAMKTIHSNKNDEMGATFQILLDKEIKSYKEKSQQRAYSAPPKQSRKTNSRDGKNPAKNSLHVEKQCSQENKFLSLEAEDLNMEKDGKPFEECLKISKTGKLSEKARRVHSPMTYLKRISMGKGPNLQRNYTEMSCVPPNNSCAAKDEVLRFCQQVDDLAAKMNIKVNDNDELKETCEKVDTRTDKALSQDKTVIEGAFEIEAV